MPLATSTRPARWAVVVIGLALVLGACAAPGGSSGPASAPPSAPIGSGATAACPAAPAVTTDPEGWGPPAQAPTVIPILIANAGELVCGPSRLLFGLVDASNNPMATPDRSFKVALFNLGRDPSKPIATVDGTFVWAVQDARGLYVVNAALPESGRYGAEVTTAAGSGAPETVRLTFDVQPSSPLIKAGDKAPASKTPTLADVGGDPTKISTDPTPLPAFYKTSVDQALAKHEPFALIFATPKFCASAQCGPTLDRIKPFVAKYPSVTFINVEPYKLKDEAGALAADLDANGQLQATDVTEQWHLISEPIVFVVDRDGIVRSSFALIFSDAELAAALDAVK